MTPLQQKIEELKINEHPDGPRVFTSYYGNYKNVVESGAVPIRISRGAPRFTPSHKAYPFLMPDKDILDMVKNALPGPDLEKASDIYLKRFNKALSELDPKETYEELLEIGKGKDVVIFCYEKPPQPCHRHYVRDWFEKHGFKLLEFPYQR